jgi:hypothetical protein
MSDVRIVSREGATITPGERGNKMANEKERMIAFRAWGYFAAAVRGEIEPYVSQRRVEEWIDTRPWAEKTRVKLGSEAKYNYWRRDLAEKMVRWLEQFAVGKEEKKPWFFGVG